MLAKMMLFVGLAALSSLAVLTGDARAQGGGGFGLPAPPPPPGFRPPPPPPMFGLPPPPPPSPGYDDGYGEEECYIQRQTVYDEWGYRHTRRVRVCN